MSGITAPSPHEVRRRWPRFRSSRIRWPEWIAALSAIVLLVSLLGLSWYSFTRASGGLGPKYYVGLSEDGWHGLSHGHWLLLVAILAALALLVLQATRPAPAVPATLSLLVMFLGGLCTIWLIIRVAIDPAGGRDLGGWVGLASAGVMTWAGYKSLALEGIDPVDAPQDIRTVTRAEMSRDTSGDAEPS